MRSLFNRQIRKLLPEKYLDCEELQPFLKAVKNSYENFEDQSTMIQRAMTISSEELFEANVNLKQEMVVLRSVITKLKEVSNTLNPENKITDDSDNFKLDAAQLIDFIDNQTKEIIRVNKLREDLLTNLEVKNTELSDYAHMISHDLKSPLRSINTLMSWFKEDNKDKIDAAGNKNLDLIVNNVEKMDALISGILNYSTISEAKIESYDVDINNLIADILNIIYIPDTITVEMSQDFPIVKGDKFRLQQLFQNLIDNAIKYNDKPQGSVQIGTFDAPGFHGFYVKDNGNGIQEKYHEKIFQTFQKLDSSIDSTGIGLSIVKKIVTFYGGNIRIESQLKKGSTFYFTLKK
jgi:light-regulated signal transduction histidine kinase (bacteriophytochrome)